MNTLRGAFIVMMLASCAGAVGYLIGAITRNHIPVEVSMFMSGSAGGIFIALCVVLFCIKEEYDVEAASHSDETQNPSSD